MKVSVIIPNYRHALYLKERIDSVLEQTYRDFEVIILDDCSPDDSREIIETYRTREKIAHIVYNERNSGSTFMQWQKGFDLAQGEYIWIAESDDFADPGFLSSCVEQLENEPSCTLAYTESRLVDAEAVGKAAKNGDMAALQDILRGVLSTDEGKRLAESLRKAMQ